MEIQKQTTVGNQSHPPWKGERRKEPCFFLFFSIEENIAVVLRRFTYTRSTELNHSYKEWINANGILVVEGKMEKNQQQRCAACKYFRRRCSSKDCIFWPYFPPSDLEKFACVHKIYGASNFGNVLERVPVELRFKAVECMVFEAQVRANDPVYGSVGIISGLLHQIKQAEFELARIQGQIAFYKAQPILIE